jgi:hypothetical protein
MAEAIYRLPRTDERYGRMCPRCAGPKTVQASECWSCFVVRLQGEGYWAARTCPDCVGPKTPGRQRCRRCCNARRVQVRTSRRRPQDHPWRKARV